MNAAPIDTVILSPVSASVSLPARRAWWAQVNVTPDASKSAVLTRGTPMGSIGSIPTGGHWHPMFSDGFRALWKNAQNSPAKNIASEIRNSLNPSRRPR